MFLENLMKRFVTWVIRHRYSKMYYDSKYSWYRHGVAYHLTAKTMSTEEYHEDLKKIYPSHPHN